jgi:predicted RNA binding protein YcfA (HicA-like mRNA interferase family)
MPGKLRRLSGADIVTILGGFGFVVISQRGSHTKLRRMAAGGNRQTLVVPCHDELDRGTERAILRQAARFIPEDELRPHFYDE